jgi:hypothetical protein
MRRCLTTVKQLITTQDTRETIIYALHKRKLIFGRGTFVCCDGSLQFGADDVPEKWEKLCSEAHIRRKEISGMEELIDSIREVFGGCELIVVSLKAPRILNFRHFSLVFFKLKGRISLTF